MHYLNPTIFPIFATRNLSHLHEARLLEPLTLLGVSTSNPDATSNSSLLIPNS